MLTSAYNTYCSTTQHNIMYHFYIILIIIYNTWNILQHIYHHMILYDSTIYKYKSNCNYHPYYIWTSTVFYMWITPTTILRVKIKILPEFKDVVNDSDRDIICLSLVRYTCARWPQVILNYDWDHPLPHVCCDV